MFLLAKPCQGRSGQPGLVFPLNPFRQCALQATQPNQQPKSSLLQQTGSTEAAVTVRLRHLVSSLLGPVVPGSDPEQHQGDHLFPSDQSVEAQGCAHLCPGEQLGVPAGCLSLRHQELDSQGIVTDTPEDTSSTTLSRLVSWTDRSVLACWLLVIHFNTVLQGPALLPLHHQWSSSPAWLSAPCQSHCRSVSSDSLSGCQSLCCRISFFSTSARSLTARTLNPHFEAISPNIQVRHCDVMFL